MKKTILPILVSILIGCQKEEDSKKNVISFDPYEIADSGTIKKFHYDTISYSQIDLSKINLNLNDIAITPSEPTVVWSLYIQLSSPAGDFVQISILDPDNNPDSLKHVGDHLATGEWNDHIFYSAKENGFQLFYLKQDDILVYIEKYREDSTGRFVKGYIEIKKELYWKWPARIILKDRIIYPGDNDYLDYCMQYYNFSKPFYFSPVKIYYNNIPK